jgi:hypothetical protein
MTFGGKIWNSGLILTFDTPANMKTVGQRNSKLLGGQAFLVKAPCDLWLGHLKINRDHLLIMTNLNNKYENFVCRGYKL